MSIFSESVKRTGNIAIILFIGTILYQQGILPIPSNLSLKDKTTVEDSKSTIESKIQACKENKAVCGSITIDEWSRYCMTAKTKNHVIGNNAHIKQLTFTEFKKQYNELKNLKTRNKKLYKEEQRKFDLMGTIMKVISRNKQEEKKPQCIGINPFK